MRFAKPRLNFARTALTFLVIFCATSLAQDEPAANASPPIKGELFPVCYQDGKYHVTAGFPHVMIYTFTGDRKRVREARLVLDLPYGFELVGASPWLPTRITDNTRRWAPERITYHGRIDIDGKTCTRRPYRPIASSRRRCASTLVRSGSNAITSRPDWRARPSASRPSPMRSTRA